MANGVGGFIAPTQGQGQGQDDGFEQRKQGWVQSLNEMVKDPVNAMTLVQVGNVLANPQQGQSLAGNITQALAEGAAFRGRTAQNLAEQQRLEREREREEAAGARQERRIGLEEERAEIARERLGQEAELGRAERESRERIAKEKIEAQERIAGQRRREERRPPAQIEMQNRIRDALLEDNPTISPAQAELQAVRISKGRTREDFVAKMVAARQSEHDEAQNDPLMQARREMLKIPPVKFDVDQAVTDAQDIWDAAHRRPQAGRVDAPQAGPESDEELAALGNKQWKDLTKSQRRRAMEAITPQNAPIFFDRYGFIPGKFEDEILGNGER